MRSVVRTGADDPGDIVAARIEELRREGQSLRGIAREIGGDDFENWRRAIYRAIDGGSLEPATAEAIENALDLPPGLIPRHHPGRRARGVAPLRSDLARDLEELAETVALNGATGQRLSHALRLLAQAQKQPLRDELLRALDGAPE